MSMVNGVCAGYYEYKMPRLMAETLLKERKGEGKKMDTQKYLCDVVNSEFGIKGYCTKVLINDGTI